MVEAGWEVVFNDTWRWVGERSNLRRSIRRRSAGLGLIRFCSEGKFLPGVAGGGGDGCNAVRL